MFLRAPATWFIMKDEKMSEGPWIEPCEVKWKLLCSHYASSLLACNSLRQIFVCFNPTFSVFRSRNRLRINYAWNLQSASNAIMLPWRRSSILFLLEKIKHFAFEDSFAFIEKMLARSLTIAKTEHNSLVANYARSLFTIDEPWANITGSRLHISGRRRCRNSRRQA